MPDIELQIVTPLKFDNCNQKLFRLCKKRVCDELNGLIGFKTDVNYKVTEALVVNEVLTMHFPLEIHIQNEASNVDELINMRINKIKQFFENFDIEKLSMYGRWCMRSLKYMNYKFDDFNLVVRTQKIKLQLNSEFNIDPDVFEQNNESAKFKYTCIVDPLLEDYGIYVNLSKKFDKMKYGFNYLHLFEHFATYGWQSLDRKNRIGMNGSTYIHGLCYIYSVILTEDDARLHLNKYLEFHNSLRDKNKLVKMKNMFDLEKKRTISETTEERELSNFARTDPFVYTTKNADYNPDVINYYANQEFSILVIGPTLLKPDMQLLNSVKKVDEPPIPKYDYLPLCLLRSKYSRGYSITKKENINKNDAIGIDCLARPLTKSIKLNMLNTTLLNILFMKHGLELKKFVTSTVLPCYNFGISGLDYEQTDISCYLCREKEN